MQAAAAARAGLGLGLDHDLFARQVLGQRSTIGAAALRTVVLDDLVVLFGRRVLGAKRGLNVLERQRHLVVGDAFGRPPELGTPQDGDDVIEPFVPGREPGIIGLHGQQQRLQALDVVRKLVERVHHDGRFADLPGR